jgi:hypothetical protein
MRASIVVFSFLLACDVGTAEDGSDTDYEAMVLHRASIEFDCPEAQITITEIDHETYMAEGCGYRATYECIVASTTAGPNECQRAPDLEPEDAGSE